MNVAFQVILTVLAFAFSTVLAAFNANISEGQCYYAPGKLLDPRFIPCGNANGGPLPCCQGLDNCLSSLACYDASAGTTYLAGCSDETYSDVLCPNKAPFDDNPWSGLVWCTSNSSVWVACEDEGPTVTKGAPCSCSQAPSNPAFVDAQTLLNIMSLPYSTGGPVSWWTYNNDVVNGHTLSGIVNPAYYSNWAGRNTAPSLSPSTATITTSSSMPSTSPSQSGTAAPSTVSSNAPAATSSNPTTTSNIAVTLPSATPQSSSGGHAKLIGFIVGFIGGTALLIAIGYFIWRQRLKKNRALKEGSPSENSGPSDDTTSHPLSGVSDPLMHEANADLRSPAWSGHKSELPADSEVGSGSGIGLVHNRHRSFQASIVSPATTSSQWGSVNGRVSRSELGGSQRISNGTGGAGALHGGSPTGGNASRNANGYAPQRTSELAGQGVYEMP